MTEDNNNTSDNPDWTNVDQVQERENETLVAPNPFKCDQCDFVGISEQSIKIHHFRMHTPKGRIAAKAAVNNFRGKGARKRFQCRRCDRSFISQSGLRYHTQTYHGEMYTDLGTETCPECGYMSNASGVALHQRLKHGVVGRFSKLNPERRREAINATNSARLHSPIAPQVSVAQVTHHTHNHINFCPNCGENLQGYRK